MKLSSPTGPRQIICLRPFKFNTQEDGEVFLFFAVDVFSGYLFSLGGSHSLEPGDILNPVEQLMQHEDFLRYTGTPFTLVLDFGDDLVDELNRVVMPHGGRVLVDANFIEDVMMPHMLEFFGAFGRNQSGL